MSTVLVDLDDLAEETAFYVEQVCVPLITCKDCKYYRVEDDDEYCTNHTIKDNKFWVREDYFCTDGERKE